MKTIIIIPCYNEEKRLKIDLFKSFLDKHINFLFLFVNDGSKDNTAKVLQEASQQHQGILFLDLPQNVGKAEAVRQGILHACQQWSPDFVGFYDADIATPFEDLYEMSLKIQAKQYFMITGCRIMRLGGVIDRTFFRFLSGRIFASFASSVLKLPVYDTQCGAKIFQREIAQNIFNEPFVTGWIFDVELFARIIIQYGYNDALNKIYEFPLSEWKDVSGSKVGSTEFIRQPISLIKIKRHYKLNKIKK